MWRLNFPQVTRLNLCSYAQKSTSNNTMRGFVKQPPTTKRTLDRHNLQQRDLSVAAYKQKTTLLFCTVFLLKVKNDHRSKFSNLAVGEKKPGLQRDSNP